MNNLISAPYPTQIHLGMPAQKNTFGNKTIHLFEPHISKNRIKQKLTRALEKGGINGLENSISDLLKVDNGSFTMSQIIAVLGTSKMRKRLFSLILRQSLKQVLANSYMHDNGFEKWVLINNPNFKLRLHVYEDSRLVPQENRHNHSWDFASYIIEGTLQNTIYQEDKVNGEEDLLHYRYSPVRAGKYLAEFVNMTKLKKMTDINLSPNTAYFMPAEVIHRISYEQTFKQRTITLMLTGKRKNYHCDLFSEHDFKDDERPANPFSLQDFQNRFSDLITN